MSTVTVRVPGTCGEWVQGWLWGEPVLVSCPIARYAEVQLERRKDSRLVLPPDCDKATQATAQMRALGGQPDFGADIRIKSALPRGRGYASSTADVVGVAAAAALALGVQLSPKQLGRLACTIEPSDSTMFPGLTAFAYRSGAWHQTLGPAWQWPLVILDGGVTVDTVTFNHKLDFERVKRLEPETRDALAWLAEGMRQGDVHGVGAAGRLSALAYQRVYHSELVEEAVRWADELKACGVVRAHSGSIVGLLFSASEPALEALAWLRPRFPGAAALTQTIGGGVSHIPPNAAQTTECVEEFGPGRETRRTPRSPHERVV